MPLANLGERERDVIRQCLEATVKGPFFPEWEFGTIFGLEREQVRQVLMSWPDLDETNESVLCAINNSFNNLLGYPTKNKQEIWPKFVSVSGMELARIFDKWKGRAPRASYKVRDYFDDAMLACARSMSVIEIFQQLSPWLLFHITGTGSGSTQGCVQVSC